MPTPRKLSVIRETVAIVEPPIEECSASEINYPSEILPKVNQSQPDLQLILSMPYGSFLGTNIVSSLVLVLIRRKNMYVVSNT